MGKNLRSFLYILIFINSISFFAFAQLTVAPVTIHLSDAKRSDRLIVYNTSAFTASEVSVDIKFGYPCSDSLGNTFIFFPDSINENDPSAINWISFYPRKFFLNPLEEQTIRIIARPPAALKEGEFWGRPVITATPVSSNNSTDDPTNISVNLNTVFKTVIALNYRHGNVYTSISTPEVSGSVDNDKLKLYCKLEREGNAAYLGIIKTILKNKNGDVVLEKEQEISVYYNLRKCIELDLTNIPRGEYIAEVELNTNRAGQNEIILPSKTVRGSLTFTY